MQTPKETISGVQIFRVPISRQRGGKLNYIFTYLAFLLVAFFYVSALHLRNRYSLIHVHNMPDLLVFSALIPKMMGVPVILDVHDPMRELFLTIFVENTGESIAKGIKSTLEQECQLRGEMNVLREAKKSSWFLELYKLEELIGREFSILETEEPGIIQT